MTIRGASWSVRLMAAAHADVRDVIDWTDEHFGEKEARVYGQTLASAVRALEVGPTAVGVKKLTGLAEGLFTLHVARDGYKGRHVLLFRIAPDKRRRSIEVLRVLHDGMDLPSHALRARRG